MTSLRELWHNGAKRLLLILIIIASFILLITCGVAISSFTLDNRLRTVTENQKLITSNQQSNTEAIQELKQEQVNGAELLETLNESWVAFQKAKPDLPVPQVDPKDGEIDVLPPKTKPKSTASPVRKKSKSRPTPTPKPWWRR